MIENKTNTTQMPTAVYDAYFIAESSEQTQFEKINVGLFSTETFALEFAVVKIKKSIENLCDILSDDINTGSGKELKKKDIENLKKVIKFLKETHESLLNKDFSKKEINSLIESIASEIIEKLSVEKLIEISDMSNLFDPFCHEFFNSYGDLESIETFNFVIEERFIDQVL